MAIMYLVMTTIGSMLTVCTCPFTYCEVNTLMPVFCINVLVQFTLQLTTQAPHLFLQNLTLTLTVGLLFVQSIRIPLTLTVLPVCKECGCVYEGCGCEIVQNEMDIDTTYIIIAIATLQ